MDYLIVKESEENLPVCGMSIGVREESDHLPLEVVKRGTVREGSDASTGKLEQESWVWKKEKGKEFKMKLAEKWREREETERRDIEGRLEFLGEIIRGATREVGLKRGRNRGGVCMDAEYRRQKKEVRRMLKRFRKTRRVEEIG